MGLFKPAWQSDNEEKALRAVEKVIDQQKLAEIAKTAPLDDVRIAAVEKIVNQSVLEYIAKNDTDDYVRVSAIRKMTNQSALLELAKRKDCNRHLDKVSYPSVVATKKLTEQNAISEVGLNAFEYCARVAAIENINDRSVLHKIAKNDKDEWVRAKAAVKINDDMVLAKVICSLEAGSSNTKKLFDMLKSEEAMLYIAVNMKHSGIKYIEHFDDPLREVGFPVIEESIKRISNQKFLKVIIETGSVIAASAAFNKITDESVRVDILKNIETKDELKNIIKDEIEKLEDQIILQDIARNAKNSNARYFATCKLNDLSILKDIAKNDKDEWVRYVAEFRVNESK